MLKTHYFRGKKGIVGSILSVFLLTSFWGIALADNESSKATTVVTRHFYFSDVHLSQGARTPTLAQCKSLFPKEKFITLTIRATSPDNISQELAEFNPSYHLTQNHTIKTLKVADENPDGNATNKVIRHLQGVSSISTDSGNTFKDVKLNATAHVNKSTGVVKGQITVGDCIAEFTSMDTDPT